MRRSFSMPLLLRLPPRGTALVEFALILPFLVVMLVGLCDLGFAAYDALAVQAAAEAGAQYVALNGWNPTAIATVVSGASGAGPITATPAPSQVYGCPDGGFFTIVASGATCPSGSPPGLYASVSAQLQYTSVLPYPGLPSPLTLTGQAYRRIN